MRHFLTSLMAAAFVVSLALGLGQANAAPLPTLNGPASQVSPVENVGYYGYGNRRYGGGYGGYYPRYRYYQPHRYYRPHYYGNHYRPYYRNYGYRPHYYRRYW